VAWFLSCALRGYAAGPNSWQIPPPTIGNWSTPANWPNGLPTNAIGDVAYIDNGGTAEITQTVTVRDVVLGGQVGQSGNLVQSSGKLSLFGDMFVGNYGQGTYEFNNGEQQGGDIFVAAQLGSVGTLKINAGTFRPGYVMMGSRFGPDATGGTATIIQSGGSIEVFYATVYLDGNATRYELKAGSLRARNQAVSGKSAGNRFIQSGGTNDTHSQSGGGYGQGLLTVGVEGTHLAMYELSGGDLNTTTTEVGGYRGLGKFVQTGGQHHVFQTLNVAAAEMSSGSYVLSGGKIIVDQAMNVGTRTAGDFTIIGASAMVQSRDFAVGSLGTLNFEIGGLGVSPINVTRNASVGGLLKIVDNGAPAGVFPLVVAGNSLSLTSLNVQLPGPTWSWFRSGNQLLAMNVPEPVAAPLLSIFVGCLFRRRGQRGPNS
jgi:hypothetical protein